MQRLLQNCRGNCKTSAKCAKRWAQWLRQWLEAALSCGERRCQRQCVHIDAHSDDSFAISSVARVFRPCRKIHLFPREKHAEKDVFKKFCNSPCCDDNLTNACQRRKLSRCVSCRRTKATKRKTRFRFAVKRFQYQHQCKLKVSC